MENPNTPPRTPEQGHRNKRARSESPSPRTPSPNRQEGTPQAPGAPQRPTRRRLLNQNNFVAIDLNSALTEAARLEEEAKAFLAEQTGDEQQVPGSPYVSDDEEEDEDCDNETDF
jgi:hypothetical protein